MSTPEVTDERRQLTRLAYRMLGSVADAEDVVQEAYARWYAQTDEQRDAVESPGAWLTKVASRICLDVLRSARVRRESYVGEWLPEPLPGSAPAQTGDPADRVALDESIGMAFLVVLESMTPAERVAFVLHDVFRYPFAEIAEIVGRTPAACRQLAVSARRRVDAARIPAAASTKATGSTKATAVVRDFKRAWDAKDIGALVGLLDPDAVMVADGGGVVGAAPRPIEGRDRIAYYALELAARVPDLAVEESVVNGLPGLVARHGDTVAAVMAFAFAGDRIARIWTIRNPEKLRHWTIRNPDEPPHRSA